MNKICNGVVDSSKLHEPLTDITIADCASEQSADCSNQIPQSGICLSAQKNVGHPQTFCDAFSEFLMCSNRARNRTECRSDAAANCESNIRNQKHDYVQGSLEQKEAFLFSTASKVGKTDEMISNSSALDNSVPGLEIPKLSSVGTRTREEVLKESAKEIAKSTQNGSLVGIDEHLAIVCDNSNDSNVEEQDKKICGLKKDSGNSEQFSVEKPIEENHEDDVPSEKLSSSCIVRGDETWVERKDEKSSVLTESQDSGICDVEMLPDSNSQVMTDNAQHFTVASFTKDDLMPTLAASLTACSNVIPPISSSLSPKSLNDDFLLCRQAKESVATSAAATEMHDDGNLRSVSSAAPTHLQTLESCCRPVRVMLRRLTADAINAFNDVKPDPLQTCSHDTLLPQKTPTKKDTSSPVKSRQPKTPKSDTKKRKPKQSSYLKDDLVDSITLDLVSWLPQLAEGGSVNRRGSGVCKRKYDSYVSDESLDDVTPYIPNFMTHMDFPIKGCSLVEKWKKVCELEREWLKDRESSLSVPSFKIFDYEAGIKKTSSSSGSQISCSGTNKKLGKVSGLLNSSPAGPLILLQKSSNSDAPEQTRKKCKAKKKDMCSAVPVSQSQIVAEPPMKAAGTVTCSETVNDINSLPDCQEITNTDQFKSEPTSSKSQNLSVNCLGNGKIVPLESSGVGVTMLQNSSTVSTNSNASDAVIVQTVKIVTVEKTQLKSIVEKTESDLNFKVHDRTSIPQTLLSTTSTAGKALAFSDITVRNSFSPALSGRFISNPGNRTLLARVPQTGVLRVQTSIPSSFTCVPTPGHVQTSNSRAPVIITRVRVSAPSFQSAVGSLATNGLSSVIRIQPPVRSSFSVANTVGIIPSAAKSLLIVPPRPKILKSDITRPSGSCPSSFSNIQTTTDIRSSIVSNSISSIVSPVRPAVTVIPAVRIPISTQCFTMNSVSSSAAVKSLNSACHSGSISQCSVVSKNPEIIIKNVASPTDKNNKCLGKMDVKTVCINAVAPPKFLHDLNNSENSKSSGITCLNSGPVVFRANLATSQRSCVRMMKQNGSTLTVASTGTARQNSLTKKLKPEEQVQQSIELSRVETDKMMSQDQDCNQDMSSWLAASMGLYTCICGAAFSDGWSCHQHQLKCSASSLS